MIAQDNYYICTIDELAEVIVRQINLPDPGKSRFNPVNFALTDYDDTYIARYTPEEIASGAEGWYGIRRIDTGFDDPDLMLCVDYYGGGCASFVHLFDGMTGGEMKEQIKTSLIRTLCSGENISAEDVLDSWLSAETTYEAVYEQVDDK